MKFEGETLHSSAPVESLLRGWLDEGGGVTEQLADLKMVTPPGKPLDNMDNLMLANQENSLAVLKPVPIDNYGGGLLTCDPTMTQLNAPTNGVNGHHQGNGNMQHDTKPVFNNCNMSTNGHGNDYYSPSPSDMVVSSTSALVNGYTNGHGIRVKEEGEEGNNNNDFNNLTNEIDDIAALIGISMADTTVSNINVDPLNDPEDIRNTWIDIDEWIENACSTIPPASVKDPMDTNTLPSQYVNPTSTTSGSPTNTNDSTGSSNGISSSTLHSLLSQPYSNGIHNRKPHQQQQQHSEMGNGYNTMSMLQARLQQNGHHNGGIKIEAIPTTTYSVNHQDPFLIDSMPHSSTHLSQPSPVGMVSTSSQNPNMTNGRGYHRKQHGGFIRNGMKDSTDNEHHLHGFPRIKHKGRLGKSGKISSNPYGDGSKEKPVHRCGICSRGFLNKSNIKVHLRTHTGEKPFKCEHCGKAFRQKAHLLKHMQIHKRVTRD